MPADGEAVVETVADGPAGADEVASVPGCVSSVSGAPVDSVVDGEAETEVSVVPSSAERLAEVAGAGSVAWAAGAASSAAGTIAAVAAAAARARRSFMKTSVSPVCRAVAARGEAPPCGAHRCDP